MEYVSSDSMLLHLGALDVYLESRGGSMLSEGRRVMFCKAPPMFCFHSCGTQADGNCTSVYNTSLNIVERISPYLEREGLVSAEARQ